MSNFIWRISTATINEEKSSFTRLEGIIRSTMVLEGQLILKHKDRYQVSLKRFDQDQYSGEWDTRSIGKVTNFNLMTAKGCEGEIRALHLSHGEAYHEVIQQPDTTFVQLAKTYYCVNGSLTIMVNEKMINLSAGDMLVLNKISANEKIKIALLNKSETNIDMIKTKIYFHKKKNLVKK